LQAKRCIQFGIPELRGGLDWLFRGLFVNSSVSEKSSSNSEPVSFCFPEAFALGALLDEEDVVEEEVLLEVEEEVVEAAAAAKVVEEVDEDEKAC
jgi:hypothetical protein